jgi:stage V sporulation protein S
MSTKKLFEDQPEIIRVKSDTDSAKLCGSIISAYEKNKSEITLRVIGASALNQAVKAVIMSNQPLSTKGLQAKIYPVFVTIKADKNNEIKDISAIELRLDFERIK